MRIEPDNIKCLDRETIVKITFAADNHIHIIVIAESLSVLHYDKNPATVQLVCLIAL